jgi:hypothetical protein
MRWGRKDVRGGIEELVRGYVVETGGRRNRNRKKLGRNFSNYSILRLRALGLFFPPNYHVKNTSEPYS